MQRVEQGSPVLDFSEWIDFDGAVNDAQFFSVDGDAAPDEVTFPLREENLDFYQHLVPPQTSSLRSLAPWNHQQLAIAPVQFTGSQQIARGTPRPMIPPTFRIFSLDEEISKRIDGPYVPQLRCLFGHLGSTQSIICFKRALCDLRGRESGDSLVLRGAKSDADHLRIVRRLREKSAADSLLTMCHTVRLFQDDADDLVRRQGSFVVQTSTSFGGLQRAAAGNPLSLNKAAITDRKMELLFPDLVMGSKEYRQERRYITNLRRSAAKLALFSNVFGFGILAFLPYTDPFGNGSHLNKCVTILNASMSQDELTKSQVDGNPGRPHFQLYQDTAAVTTKASRPTQRRC